MKEKVMELRKVFGYITRCIEEQTQVLVFEHLNPYAGYQIPKGTVKEGETLEEAVHREMKEETNLDQFLTCRLLDKDEWITDEGELHERVFFHLEVRNAPDEWRHCPTGGGPEEGVVFRLFWITAPDEVPLARGHGDYLHFLIG